MRPISKDLQANFTNSATDFKKVCSETDSQAKRNVVIAMASPIFISFCLVVLFTQLGNCALTEFQMDREIKLLSKTASHILRQFYSKHASAIFLIRLALHPYTYYKQSEIMNRILLHTRSIICYVIEKPKYMKFSPFLRTNAIIFIDSYEAFR